MNQLPWPPLWPFGYNLPPDHCADVLAGSYDIPYNPTTPPVILDLGANVGAFCRWAAKRWPGCTIHAYEPHPGNFALLKRTVAEMCQGAEIICHQTAVSNYSGEATLFEGVFNCGEWSLADVGNNRGRITVPVMRALDLPPAQILKLDVEGAEVEVLSDLTKNDRIKEFSAVMMEVHAAQVVDLIKGFMIRSGFRLIREHAHFKSRVELAFLK